jgi:predicted esterase
MNSVVAILTLDADSQADEQKWAGVASYLLSNVGFESGDKTPECWKAGTSVEGNDYIWERKLARTGSSSLCLRMRTEGIFPITQWSQSFDHRGTSSHLRVSGWVKADKAHKAIIDVQFENEAAEWTHKWAGYIGAEKAGDPPADHDWREYSGTVDLPEGVKTIRVSLQIYGPGTVWFDDVEAVYVNSGKPAKAQAAAPDEDRLVGDDPNKRYFLIGPDQSAEAPASGYKLLIVLPGGDGSADFHPFVKSIFTNALSKDYVLAQLVAPKWSPEQAESIVWPTKGLPWDGMKFTTEEFITAVVNDVAKRLPIDPACIFTLSWSSSGPAAYAASLTEKSPIAGSLVAMSVFKPAQLPDLKSANDKAYYILHSPDDFIPMSFPESARDQLASNGAATTLQTYEGGHGWHGDVFGNIRAGIEWLQKHSRASAQGR